MSEKINWEITTTENDIVNLKDDLVIGGTAKVSFLEVKQVKGDMIVATVETVLPGNTLWLKGKFGPQNGLLSLMKAAKGGDNIEGKEFDVSKIESDKSPAGYAYLWKKL